MNDFPFLYRKKEEVAPSQIQLQLELEIIEYIPKEVKEEPSVIEIQITSSNSEEYQLLL